MEVIMKTLEIGDFCHSLLAHQISRSRGGSTNYHNFEVVMSINDFLMYLQQLYHDMKTYVISIDNKIKRNANAVNVHEGNDIHFSLWLVKNHKTVQVCRPIKFYS